MDTGTGCSRVLKIAEQVGTPEHAPSTVTDRVPDRCGELTGKLLDPVVGVSRLNECLVDLVCD